MNFKILSQIDFDEQNVPLNAVFSPIFISKPPKNSFKVIYSDSIKKSVSYTVEVPGNTKEKRAFRKGPHMESFEKLVTQYDKMIHSIIHSLHIYKQQEEYYQTGLIGLWEASNRFDPTKGSFTSFAYCHIKGKILNELVKNKKVEDRSVCVEEETLELMADAYFDDPLNETTLRDYVVTLTENQKKWLHYTVEHDLSVKEIAHIEGVSMSAVKQWRAGAREKLKKIYMVSNNMTMYKI
jgi:RNA polymerase sigma factor (sigma-70 family)